ncbi:ALP1-like protein [Tanacetum coccineum]|uniref:ALP1-like protein n=1 Tax=Tanacetum coccineum TaxID=301880 RepID=A0ABQ4ZXJ3_9ASTR
MNSYTFMDLDVEEGEDVNSRRKAFIKQAIAFIKSRRQANRVTRNNITRDRSGAHERLVAAFFNDYPMYDATRFRKTFRMASPIFNQIVTDVSNHDAFFCTNMDCTERKAISRLLKCTYAIHQLAYGVHADFLNEYMQINLWICHAFFGVDESNNDINVLYQSSLFNDLKTGRAPEIPVVTNDVTYRCGYYLVDGIYPKLATLVKTIPEPADDDHKRILYKQKHESARKDVERAFGVLKKKLIILANPTRALKKNY